MNVAELAKWAPSQLRDYYKQGRKLLSPLELRLLEALGSDSRARVFWESVEREAGGHEREPEPEPELVWNIYYASLKGLSLPEKPGNLPPKDREGYLSDVRKHALILKNLLLETRFDQRIDKAKREEARTIDDLAAAFVDFPFGALTLLLDEVVTWTKLDDRHDLEGSPAWMLRQRGLPARKLHLLFHVDQVLDESGLNPPDEALADLLSALLRSPPDKPISGKNVESLRKSLAKYEAERRNARRPRPRRLFVDSVTRLKVPPDE